MTFPVSPSLGDQWTEDNTLWEYTVYGWQRITVGVGNDSDYSTATDSLNPEEIK